MTTTISFQSLLFFMTCMYVCMYVCVHMCCSSRYKMSGGIVFSAHKTES